MGVLGYATGAAGSKPDRTSISVLATRSVITLGAPVARTKRAKVSAAGRDRVAVPACTPWRTSASAGRFLAHLSQ
jgi:hypothetical protein